MTGLWRSWGVIVDLQWGGKEYTQRATRVQACGKHSITPPLWEVSSSQDLMCTFRGAITHQLPSLPLLAFCVLWHSPLSYSCCLRSFPVLRLDGSGECEARGWRGAHDEAAQMRWEAALTLDGLCHHLYCNHTPPPPTLHHHLSYTKDYNANRKTNTTVF